MGKTLRCGWLTGTVIVAALLAFAAAALAETIPAPPVPPAPSLKADVVGDDGTLLFSQLGPLPPPPGVVPPPPPVWGALFLPRDSGTDLDLLGTGWLPNGSASLISGGATALNAADALLLPYPKLQPTSILPDELKAGGALRGIDWLSVRSALAVWPPQFIDAALIAGDRTSGAGRLLLLAPDGTFVTIQKPEFEGVDLWDVAWHPSGRAALAVGGTDTEGVAFLLQAGSVSGPLAADATVTEVYRGPGGPLKGVAFSPNGALALMVGGQEEVGPAVLARVLRFDAGTATVTDLTTQANAAGIEFRDVAFRSPLPILSPAAAPITVNVAALAGGNTTANIAAAIAYTATPTGGTFTPLFAKPGPAINGLAFDRSGLVLMAVCDQPSAGGNAPVIVASPGGVVPIDSGVPKNLRAVSIRQVGEMLAWLLRPLPPIFVPSPEEGPYVQALSVGLKSSLVEGSAVHGVAVVLKTAAAPTAAAGAQQADLQVTAWVVLDVNKNGIRDPGEPVLGAAQGAPNQPIPVAFANVLPVPPGAEAALIIGVAFPSSVSPETIIGSKGALLALAGVLALGAESERVLFVRGLPIVSPPIAPRLILAFGAWPNPFSPNGDGVKDTTDLVFALARPATCTIKLFNGSGALVRTLLDHVASPAGKNSVAWNGKDENGAVVPDGAYAGRLWATDADGVTQSATAPVIVDTKAPVLSDVTAVPPVFSPNGDGRADFTRIVFRLSEMSAISMRVYRSGTGTPLGEIFWGIRPAGLNGVIWDGKVSGVKVPDGRYTVVVFLRDMGGNPGTSGRTDVVVDTVRPVVGGLKAVPSTFSPNGDGVADTTTIGYGLSERSRFFLVAVGQGLRIPLANGEWQNAGLHTVVWDGLVNGSPVPNGTYRLAAMAMDEAMNLSFIPIIEVTVANP